MRFFKNSFSLDYNGRLHGGGPATHCRGGTILMRRQNVTAGCLNFAKSHFAVPDSGVA